MEGFICTFYITAGNNCNRKKKKISAKQHESLNRSKCFETADSLLIYEFQQHFYYGSIHEHATCYMLHHLNWPALDPEQIYVGN